MLDKLNNNKEALTIMGALAMSLLAWAGAQFSALPSRVTALEVKEVKADQRLDRIESKLDKLLERSFARGNRSGP